MVSKRFTIDKEAVIFYGSNEEGDINCVLFAQPSVINKVEVFIFLS